MKLQMAKKFSLEWQEHASGFLHLGLYWNFFLFSPVEQITQSVVRLWFPRQKRKLSATLDGVVPKQAKGS